MMAATISTIEPASPPPDPPLTDRISQAHAAKNRMRNTSSIPRPEPPLNSFSRIMVKYLPFLGYQSDITLMADTQGEGERLQGVGECPGPKGRQHVAWGVSPRNRAPITPKPRRGGSSVY